MARKKKRYSARPFESYGSKFVDPFTKATRHDTSANIFESMLLDANFQSLSNRQKMLYVICKSQFYGHRKPCADYDVDLFPDLKSDECFYLNFASVQRYGIYSRNMKKEFYNDMRALEAKGFIETIMKGGFHKKSIYKFSAHWKFKN